MTTRNAAPQYASATDQEIHQQPQLWRTVADDVARRRAALRETLQPMLGDPSARIVLTGAGTSAFAGAVAAAGLSRTLRRRVDAVATTDIVADPRGVFAEDVPTVLVSLARSGDSPESVAATVLADEVLTTVRHLVITCNSKGDLAVRHDARPDSAVLLMPSAANDTGFAMTSSFTCMLLACNLVLTDDADAEQAIGCVPALADAATRLLAERIDDLTALAARRHSRVVYLGSGPLTALAREAALKLLELTAGEVVTYWDSSLGFRHGPKSVLEPGTLAVVLVSTDPYTRRYDQDVATELRAALGDDHVLELTTRDDGGSAWPVEGVAGASDLLVALPYAVVVQQFALAVSVERGHTPDNPFPAGELSRVVRGVRIHPLG